MRIALGIMTSTLVIAAAAATLFANGGPVVQANGIPNMEGFYEGTIKLKINGMDDGRTKEKGKLDITLNITQTDDTLRADVVIGEPPVQGLHSAEADFSMDGGVGNGTFYLCTGVGDDPELTLIGKAKEKGEGKIKLTAKGFYIGFTPSEAGTATFKAKRTGPAILN